MRTRLSTRHIVWIWTLGLALALAAALGPAQASAQRAPDADWWSAIRRDDASAIQDMLLRRTDLNAVNQLGNPALTQAARDQSWKAFDILSRAPGIQIDQPNANNETALMYLCILGQTQRALALIQAGAQVNRLGWTPLHYAASKGQLETARMLIEHGAIVNAPGPDGTTPLMMAAYSGKASVAQLLLQHGADPTMFNAAHETAADWARKGSSDSLASRLDAAASQTAQARAGQAAGPTGPESAQTQPVAPDDGSSFSRYFDLGRFEDTAPGR